MFCSKCGTKIGEKDDFCPKCGHSVSGPSSSQKAEDEDKKTTPVTPAPARNRGCLSCLFGFSIIVAIIAITGVLIYAGTTKDRSTEAIVGIIFFFLTFSILGVWGLSSLNHKNKLAHKDKSETSDPNENKTIESTSQEKKTKRSGGRSSDCLSIMAIIVMIAVLIGFFAWIKNKPEDKTDEPDTKTSTNWDGNYNAKMTKPNCDSSVEFTSFQVSDNAVINNWGKNAPIGADGRATIIMDTGTVMTTDLTFTKDGVTGVWKTTRGCSGTLSATKSSSWF